MIISLDPAVSQVGGHKTDRVVKFTVGSAPIFENDGFFVGEVSGTLENHIGQVHSVFLRFRDETESESIPILHSRFAIEMQ